MNKVVLIGRLVRDPSLKFTPGTGTAVVDITLAVDRRVKKDGQPEADFLKCIAFGKTAETMGQYLTKGRLIGVSGSIRTGSYDAKDGTKRYTTDIYIDEFQFLEKNQNNNSVANNSKAEERFDFEDMTEIKDGDIPF